MAFLRKNWLSLLKLILAWLRGRSYPFVVVLRLNDSCNLACKYCDSYQLDKTLHFKKLEAFLDQVYAIGCRFFILTGGEPFLYEDRMHLENWFAKRNCYLVINTNGKRIDHPQYQHFINQADDVLVSLDGLETLNDENRGKGSFQNVMKTLEFLRKQKKKVTLSCVLTEKSTTVENLEFLLSIKKKYKANIGLSPITADGRINNSQFSNQNALSSEKLRLLKEFYHQNRRHFPELSDPLLAYFVRPKPFVCQTYRYALYVDVSGEIFPCINVTDRSDAVVANVATYQNQLKPEVRCEKCSCTPLIMANLFFQTDAPKASLGLAIFQRYLRLP